MMEEEDTTYEDMVTISSRFRNFINGGVTNSMAGSNFNKNNVEKTKAPSFEKEPYYLLMDDYADTNNHNLSLSMSRKVVPTFEALVDCCLAPRDDPDLILFQQGMFVEYLAKDMQWKVGVVNRVILQSPDDWDFKVAEITDSDKEVFYNVGVEGLLSKKRVRAPTRGLQYIFGTRPWLWQQFVMLKIEKRLRFDADHEYDFEEFDCVEFATSNFDLWLEAEENVEFKELYDSQEDIIKYLLRDNLFKPFRIMDDVVEDQDRWNLEENPNFSVYTYLGVLGSGFPLAIMVFVIQLFAPLVILYNVMFISGDDANFRFEVVDNGNFDVVSASGNFLPTTDFETFCFERNERREGAILIFIVTLVYMTTVVPNSFVIFYRVSGNADTSFSRATSLIQTIFDQDDLNPWQIVGYKMDRLMNTGYHAILYSIMLFILVQTPVILDIILNALAIEFIAEIDERVVASSWYDFQKRHLRAGIIELIIRQTLRLDKMQKPKEFCKFFNIDITAYEEALGGKKPLFSPTVARADDSNPLYMTKKERVFDIVAGKAKEEGYPFILAEYQKRIVEFGVVDRVLRALKFKQSGVFHRFHQFRTWSRWEKILFLPIVPEKLEYGQEKSPGNESARARLKAPVASGRHDASDFFLHVITTLLGVDLVSTSAISIWRNNFHLVPLKVIFGLLEIIFYFFQVLFPIFVGLALFFGPYCY